MMMHVRGSYALGILFADQPGVVYAVRKDSPLIVGKAENGSLIASDVPALLKYTRTVYYIDNLEIARLTPDSIEFFNIDKEPVEKEASTIEWDAEAAEKGGYEHFMMKEIHEQPTAVRDTLSPRIKDGRIDLSELGLDEEAIKNVRRIYIIGCGSAYHVGMAARYVFESLARIPVEVDVASEFRYRNPVLEKDALAMVISQSGETADTLAALRIAREHGVPVLGLCNVVGSSIARESSAVIYTQAGPEISVASTKAMCSQMLMLALVALYWGGRQGIMDAAARARQIALLESLPSQLDAVLPAMHEKARQLARAYAQARNFFYLGRGHCYPLALEGALKLKELSYIHAEGYAAGEMKHGPIALIDPAFPTFALALDDALFPKVKSNIVEVQARQGKVIALTNPGMDLAVDDVWEIPALPAPLAGFMALPAMQLFSYEMADYLGRRFGERLLEDDGSVCKPALLEAMQQDPGLRKEVEQMVHALVRDAILAFWDKAEAEGKDCAVAEIPLHFECGWHKAGLPGALSLTVRCPREIRLQRIMATRGWNEEKAATLEAWQWPAERKEAASDLVVDNAGTPADLRARIPALLEQLTALRQQAQDDILRQVTACWQVK